MNVRDFAGVRAEVAARTRLPEPGVLRDLGRRRRQTHRSMSIVASVVAMALIAAGGFGLSQLRSNAGKPVALLTTPQPAPPRGLVCDAVAYDVRDIYYTIDPAWTCDWDARYVLSHSADGGQTWRTWRMPALGQDRQIGQPVLIGRSTIVWRGLISRDAGQTWYATPPVGTPVDGAPAGWPVMTYTVDSTYASTLTLAALDPATGQLRPLAAQPAGDGTLEVANPPALRPAADGSLWVTTRSSDEQSTAVAISRDRGASWSRSPLGPGAGGAVATYDGKVAYAVGTTELGSKFIVLHRTVDSGRSWQRISAAEVADFASFPSRALAVRADGALMGLMAVSSTDGGPLKTSTDGGRTFAVALPITSEFVSLSGGGYLVAGRTGKSGAATQRWLSADGVHFQPLDIPPGASRPA